MYESRHAKIAFIAYANSKDSDEPAHPRGLLPELMLFANVSARPKANFSQRTRRRFCQGPRHAHRKIDSTSRKHAYIILTPLNPTFI